MPAPPLPPSSSLSIRRDLPTPFRCTCKPDGWSSVWVHLSGELDLATCPQFERTLLEAQGKANVVSVDLQELTLIDCAGLTVIFHAATQAIEAGTRLILVGCWGQVQRLLELTGLQEKVEMVKFSEGV